MKYVDFIKKVKENSVPKNLYCINDSVVDDVYCIRQNYNKWEVFYRERGEEFEKEVFINEDDAWENLLSRLLKTVEITNRINERNP